MKPLKNYLQTIFESLLTKGKIVPIYIDFFGSEAKNKVKPDRSISKGRGKTEIIRAWFGDDDETQKDNCLKFLHDALGIDLDKITYDYGHFPESSGYYPSFKIVSKENMSLPSGMTLEKDKPAYIVCRGGNVQKKELTPNKLGLGGKMFKSIQEISDTISSNKALEKNEVARALTLQILDKVNHLEINKEFDTFQEFANESNHNIDLSSLTLKDLDEKDIKNLLNDFGEVIVACYILKNLSNKHTVFFPTASNAALYDYIIDYSDSIKQCNISSKNGAGANPSSVAAATLILELAKQNNGKLDFVEDIFLQDILPVLARNYNNTKLSVVTTKYALMFILADKLNDKIAKEILKTLEDYNVVIDPKSFQLDVESINKVYESKKLVEFLTKINQLCGYNKSTSGMDKLNPEKINQLWDIKNNNQSIKQGCLCQPFQRYAVDFLNKNYSEQITKIASTAQGGYQLYIINKNNNLQIMIKQMNGENAKYKLTVESSIKNPNLKSIGLRLIK